MGRTRPRTTSLPRAGEDSGKCVCGVCVSGAWRLRVHGARSKIFIRIHLNRLRYRRLKAQTIKSMLSSTASGFLGGPNQPGMGPTQDRRKPPSKMVEWVSKKCMKCNKTVRPGRRLPVQGLSEGSLGFLDRLPAERGPGTGLKLCHQNYQKSKRNLVYGRGHPGNRSS